VEREERPELPEEALREAVVNALIHRDYRSTANVQVYIFKDRVEIVSPGGLPAGMTEADLGIKSIPRNPLLFGMLYRMNAVEHIGSGIKRIRNLCREYGVAEPRIEVSEHWFTVIFPRPDRGREDQGEMQTLQDTLQVTPHVRSLIHTIKDEMSREEIVAVLGLRDRANFIKNYLQQALDAGFMEMTIPTKPNSRHQKYRLTDKGKQACLSKNKPITQQDTQQVTLQVTQHVMLVLKNIQGEMSRNELMKALELKDRVNFMTGYLQPALDADLVEMTIPDKPRSGKQRYRLTESGKALLK
jgi:ATP-dependent DNA helicase RecG